MVQEFTRVGNAPDPTALLTAVVTVLGSAAFDLSVRVTNAGAIVVDIDRTAWTPAEILAVQAAITAVPDTSATRTLVQLVDSVSPLNRAILFTILDQVNVIRAALPVPLPAITPAQVVAAVRNKIPNI